VQGLDYSAARLSGAAIKQAGYDFVIRYVGTPGRTKNITAFEYADLTAAGVAVALVYEDQAQDALRGYPAGEAAARAARADADSIGFPADRPIYFAVDWVATWAEMPAIIDYLSGAAGALGVGRVGVYGFQATIQAAMVGRAARWFWQCGARSALVPGTHLYQHNNDNTTVSGITCDVNDALAPDFGQTTGDAMPSVEEIRAVLVPAFIDAMRYQVLATDHTAFTIDGGRNVLDELVQTRADVAQANAALAQVVQLLGAQHSLSAVDIATVLAPLVIAALPAHLNKLSPDDLRAVAAAVVAEEGRRLAGTPTP
jgi:hypothetical protein